MTSAVHAQQPARHRTWRWRRAWYAAIAGMAVAIAAWAGWPAGGAAMTTEDFRQLYEGNTSVDPAMAAYMLPW
jgi:hypothetical protein